MIRENREEGRGKREERREKREERREKNEEWRMVREMDISIDRWMDGEMDRWYGEENEKRRKYILYASFGKDTSNFLLSNMHMREVIYNINK